MSVERDKLMILVIVGRRTDEHCFRRKVGMGSKSQLVSESSLKIYSMHGDRVETREIRRTRRWRSVRTGANMIKKKISMQFMDLIREEGSE